MRKSLILVPLLVCATPALAQAPSDEVSAQLTDPAVAEKLANTAQALSNVLLDLRVGELQAAVEGREATAAEKKLTVRDLARRGDPNFERNLRRQMVEVRPKIEQSMKAFADALPAVKQSIEQAQKSLERAAANMPQPGYPKQ